MDVHPIKNGMKIGIDPYPFRDPLMGGFLGISSIISQEQVLKFKPNDDVEISPKSRPVFFLLFAGLLFHPVPLFRHFFRGPADRMNWCPIDWCPIASGFQ